MDFYGILGDFFKVAAGAIFGGVGTWLTQLRAERKRKAELAEGALLSWLDSQHILINRIANFSRRIEREPSTLQELQTALDDASAIQDIATLMASALNRCFLYEKAGVRKTLLDLLTQKYSLLLQSLEIIISHHGGHLHFRETLKSLDNMEESVKADLRLSDSDKAKMLKPIELLRSEALEHLSTCGIQLSDNATTLAAQCNDLRDDARRVRRLLASVQNL